MGGSGNAYHWLLLYHCNETRIYAFPDLMHARTSPKAPILYFVVVIMITFLLVDIGPALGIKWTHELTAGPIRSVAGLNRQYYH